MKKIILISGLALSIIATPALANCPSGNCAVEINCTTGVITYTDAPPRVNTPAPVILEPIAPTHMVVVQTVNSGFGTSGSYEQVQQAIQQLITAPKTPEPDPCALGGCTKVEVNCATGVTTILPLTPADIQQRLVDQYMNYARQLEMSIAAREAVIQPYVAPVINIPMISDPVVIAPAPIVFVAEPSGTVWITKNTSGEITTKKTTTAKIRTKKKK